MKLHYAALAPDGSVIGVAEDPHEATDLVERALGDVPISVQTIPDEREKNALGALDMPDLAWRASGLPQIKKSAITMRLTEAHERLYPYFEGLIKRGVETKQYDKPLGMADAWIGQNYKTEKPSQDPGRPAQVMGLTLVPAAHARLAARGEGPYANLFKPTEDRRGAPVDRAAIANEGRTMTARWKRELPRAFDTSKFTFCAGSSQDCRDSCLVFAGQNASERYNTYRKVAQTMALLNEPEAFGRMLIEAIDRWLASPVIASGRMRPFFRMNVLSDVPWELVMPWVFDYYDDESGRLQFYDYTKVPGRKIPRNYDLTFSFSGTNANREWAMEEINHRGRRIAVVFLGHKRVGDRWVPVKKKGPDAIHEIPLPKTFWGLPVVDGDVSDVRPYDPAPACVGLRWKTPSGARAGTTIDLGSSAFVTPVYIVSSAMLASQVGAPVSRWRGGEEPNPAAEQWLVAAVTPRQQSIEQPMSQPAG